MKLNAMIVLHHCLSARSFRPLWMLEELGVPYELEIVDFRAEGGVPESYRAVQPHKKVPAIVHEGVTITERAAICTYLADAFPAAGLAPAIGDPRRGPYLSWLVYADSVIDPAIAARVNGWKYASNAFSFGSFEDMLAHVEKTLAAHPYIVGDTFTAADTQVGAAVGWATHMFDLFPRTPVFTDYLARIAARPAYQRNLKLESGS